LTKSRKALLEAYRDSYDEIQETVKCACCGLSLRKMEGERHHPAGRRKAAFLFTVILHNRCHSRVHADPAWATANGLLWAGRNSKVLLFSDAVTLVNAMPFPPLYALEIYKRYQLNQHHV
jgi:hypothetical protein